MKREDYVKNKDRTIEEKIFVIFEIISKTNITPRSRGYRDATIYTENP